MFDIGTAEMMVLAVVALIVVGPKDLPKLMRSVSEFVRKIRGFASDFRGGLEDLANEVELETDPFKEEKKQAGLRPDMTPEEVTAHIMGTPLDGPTDKPESKQVQKDDALEKDRVKTFASVDNTQDKDQQKND